MKKTSNRSNPITATKLILAFCLLALATFFLVQGCSRAKNPAPATVPSPQTTAVVVSPLPQKTAVPTPAPSPEPRPQVPATPASATSAGEPAPEVAAPTTVAPVPASVPTPAPAPAPAPIPAVTVDPAALIGAAAGALTEEQLADIETQLDQALAEGSLDQVIAALEVAASKPSAPPGIQITLSMAYGRKGLITKSYAAIVAAETAAKAPGIVFSLAAVYGRKALIAADPRAGLAIVRLSSEPAGAAVRIDGREVGVTPLDLILPSAQGHDLSLRLEGYEELGEKLSLEATKTVTLVRTLRLLPATITASSEPAGASLFVDGADRGPVPITVKVEANKEHKVELRLANHASHFELLKLGPGQAKEVAAKLSGNPGSLFMETDPPGAEVVVDDSDYFQTPHLMANLAAGQHRLTFRDFLVGKDFVSAEPKTITVEPGQRLSLKEKLYVRNASLKITGIEAGSRLSINGKSYALNDTSQGTLIFDGKIPAGIDCAIRLEKGQKVWSLTHNIGTQLVYSYTLSNFTLYHALPRRTIKVDGKDDDWAGIEPTFDPSPKTNIPKIAGSEIAGGWICRDDKNLYLKISFSNGKPALSSGVVRGLHIDIDATNNMALQLKVEKDGSRQTQVWTNKTKQLIQTGSYAVGADFIELRFPLSLIPATFLPKLIDPAHVPPRPYLFCFLDSTGSVSDWFKTANCTPQANLIIGN